MNNNEELKRIANDADEYVKANFDGFNRESQNDIREAYITGAEWELTRCKRGSTITVVRTQPKIHLD